MRKMIFTLMLAIVSSVWMTSKAMCQVSTCTCLFDDPPVAISGILQLVPLPCPESTEDIPCPPCLTIALNANEQLYYLNGLNDNLNALLDTLVYPVNATVTGHVYTALEGGLAISVQDISLHASLPSLCDEWHMLVPGFSWPDKDYTYMHRLANDTLIGGQHYVQLESNETGTFAYEGAIRESESKIYYIPAGSTHEYLLYDFNVQVGDTLTNLWIGGQESEYEQGLIRDIIVEDIEGTAPSRKFYISFTHDYWQGMFRWIEGVGLDEGPAGWYYVPGTPVDPTPEILCAYKDGKRVYATSQAEQHSCCYNAQKINSLCDEWNILEVSNVTCGDCEVYRTYHSQLTTDTIINGKVYAQLIEDGAYRAALREGNKRDVYCIPAGSTHEYLLYAFNVQEGDQLTNLWIGGSPADSPDGWTMTVEEIQETTPRTFVLSTGYTHTDEGIENYPLYITWIEGVGLTDGPIGVKRCVGCADSRGYGVLCAYKNGEQIFTSDLGEQYGCVYNYDPFAPVDTIPLYAQDDPGSSTVDPVDPNQVVATLQGDQLTIHESTGVDVTYSLNHTAPAQVPSHNRAPLVNTFRDEVTIQITQSGEYLLQLTNPSWGYTIFGQFYYAPQGIDQITNDPAPITTKVIKDSQLFILRGDKTYTLTGAEVK